MHLLHKASLQTIHVDCSVFELFLNQLHFASLDNSASKLPLSALEPREHEKAKKFDKSLFCIDANTT